MMIKGLPYCLIPLLPYFVFICGFCGSLYAIEPKASEPSTPHDAPSKWAGVDETVVERVAEAAGRPARAPFINTDQGDLLLFLFLLAGAVGGFIGGYAYKGLSSKAAAAALLSLLLAQRCAGLDETHIDQHMSHQHIQAESSSPFTYEVLFDLYSLDIWNGMVGYDHPIFQPSLNVSYTHETYGTLALEALFLYPVGSPRPAKAGGLSEMDYLACWSKPFGPVELDLGMTYYSLIPDHRDDLYEGFATLRYPNDWVTPYIIGYYDFNQTDGTYLKAGLCRGFELTDRLKLDIDLTCGYGLPKYNHGYFDTDIATFTDATAQVLLQYNLTEYLFVGGTAAFSMLLDNALRDSRFVNDTYDTVDTFWFGLHTGLHF